MLERYINVWHIITLMEREAEINIEKSDCESEGQEVRDIDAARLFCEAWQRQTARYTEAAAALLKKYVVDYIGDYDEWGYAFSISGIEYSSSWNAEVERETEPRRSLCWERDQNIPSLTKEDAAALDFAEAFHALITSCYSAVHVAAENLGWYWIDDEEFEGIYCHQDTGRDIAVPHWCANLDEIELSDLVEER